MNAKFTAGKILPHPNPHRWRHVGIRDDELVGKPYAKFYNPKLPPLPEHAKAALLHGPVAAALLPALATAPGLLAPGDSDLEDGFGLHPDGSMHVAIRTDMPHVSPAMIDWWFGWHSAEPERYKLWHPRAHVHAQWGGADPPGKSGRERYVGRVSFVDEYVGSQLSHVAIEFLPPADLGFAVPALADPEQATVICARICFSAQPVQLGYLVHHVRRTADGRGSQMRSRFWLGGPYAEVQAFGALSGLITRAARRLLRPSASQACDLLVHCAQEMSHLATFLPALHSELHLLH